MKRIISVLVVAVLLLGVMSGCGKPAKRELYNVNLDKYVTLGEYKGLSVDKSSSDFETYYDEIVDGDVSRGGLYKQKTEGTVAKGDTANIDYVGKKDGVAFEGGTAQGYDLTIGSGSFIDGFEDGLIGKEIGSTVDLNLTFPADYGSAELAGKSVVFTVTINYVTTTEPMLPAEFFEKLGFKSVEAYEKDVEERALSLMLFEKIADKSKIKDYPEADETKLYETMKTQYETMYQSQYGVSFSEMLTYNQMTEEDFKEEALKNSVYPSMKEQMILYAIMDKEGIEVSEKDIQKQVAHMQKEIGSDEVTEDDLKEFYGSYYFEALAVSENVKNFLVENAKIK